MQLPSNGDRPTAVSNGAATDNHLAGGSDNNSTGDRAAMVVGVEAGFVGVLLAVGRQKAAALVAAVPADAITHPSLRWVYSATCAALDDGAEPDPVTVVAAADRAGLVVPPAFRGQVQADLCRLYSQAPSPANADHYAQLVRSHHARRAVEAAGRRLAEDAWLGTMAEVRQMVSEEITVAITLVDTFIGERQQPSRTHLSAVKAAASNG